jgi:hypothetical protein
MISLFIIIFKWTGCDPKNDIILLFAVVVILYYFNWKTDIFKLFSFSAISNWSSAYKNVTNFYS